MEKINAAIEKVNMEVSRTQVNKSTETHLGMLRQKLSKLNQQKQALVLQQQQKANQSQNLTLKVKSKSKVNSSCLLDLQNQFLQHGLEQRQIHQIYADKFSIDEQKKQDANVDFTQYFANYSQKDKIELLCEKVLPIILDNFQVQLKTKPLQVVKVGEILMSLRPFAATQVMQPQILELVQQCFEIEELQEFLGICKDICDVL
ncbi:hypothetical protein SS50377_23768 [Spironucleus salmonicida]|uniref:Uncharacterized protein n=1 Tax=Spironucleus salmonicida TaxID=348837 RepID=V6LP41_9EUKA|nr:hypothetical protein SS50377_23768 [Spironucleus salmonicida]|eukprot:EST46447.1 Hypothetical protein SS50377_13531 [Spironucleus salmonicida]